MRIVAGVMHHETDTLSPLRTNEKDFEIVKGKAVLDKIAAAASYFREAGVEVIPTIYANALPSGLVEDSTYLEFREQILKVISKEKGRIDGIWFYLHGSMGVEGRGSAEADLLTEVRKIVGREVPIAVALDLHANMTETLVKEANVICGYRTAPHIDQEATQLKTAKLLVKSMQAKLLPVSVMVRPPMILTGDMATTTIEPGKTLIKELEVTEKREGILCATLFIGHPWMDVPNVGTSVVVVSEKDAEAARQEAKRIAKRFWDVRKEFHFEEETAEPEEAIERAMENKEYPVFVTDAGDNTTAGAPGDSAGLLKILLSKDANKSQPADSPTSLSQNFPSVPSSLPYNIAKHIPHLP